ncbi:histidine kinase, partial [Deinococcus reticulitermitis]|uniref:histidine kinase n=1 Tax=Deinococcus reticulitermitis TaxID=856736 RepID=UPI000B8566F2
MKAAITLTHWRPGLGLGAWALATVYVLAFLIPSVAWIIRQSLPGHESLGHKYLVETVGLPTAALLMTLALIFAAFAGLLVWLRPRDGMVRLVALTLLCVGTVETGLTDHLIAPDLNSVPERWLLPVLLLRALEMSTALILLYVYPDGRFRPAWTRPLSALWVGLTLAWALWPELPYNVLYGPTWRATPLPSIAFSLFWIMTGLAARLGRQREDRTQHPGLAPVSHSMVVLAFGLLAYYSLFLLPPPAGWTRLDRALLNARLLSLTLGWFPVALFRSMLRHGLHDGERLVGRALTGVLLGGVVAGAYLLIMLGVAQTFHLGDTLTLSVLATVFATLLFAPLRDLIQRRVNRFLYGERDQPMTALRTLTEQLAQARTPQGALAVLAQTTAETLKLPYLCLEAPEIPFRLELGRRGTVSEAFALLADGAEVGQLVVCAGAPLSRDVRAMLQTVAQQAAQAVQNWQLAVQVQQSRQTLVGAREDERRRLRRELHDGLGPTLAAQTLRIGSARLLLPRDPVAVAGLLSQLESDVQRAIGDVRRVVEDLRPPALDDLGLLGALERVITELSAGLSVQVRVEA